MLGHKTNLSKFQKTEITQVIFSDHNVIKFQISNRGNLRNSQVCKNQTEYASIANKSKKKSQGKLETNLR